MNVTHDERERAILVERARSLARVPAAPPEGEELLVVAFTVGDEAFCVEAAHVREVVRLRQLTAVPGAAVAVRGVTTYRGEILAVVDPRAALGRPAGALADLLWIVVLGSAEPELGLLAGEVSGVGAIRVPELRPLPAEASPRARRLARAVTERAVIVLDGAALLADPELFAARDDAAAGDADA